MKFDWSLSLGSLLTLVSILLTALGIWIRQDRLLNTLISELRTLRVLVERMDVKGTEYSHGLNERLIRVETEAEGRFGWPQHFAPEPSHGEP